MSTDFGWDNLKQNGEELFNRDLSLFGVFANDFLLITIAIFLTLSHTCLVLL